MSKQHYYYDMPQETYNYIISKSILKESKKEKTILDMALKGKSIKEISQATGYSERTINNRKKDIYGKLISFL